MDLETPVRLLLSQMGIDLYDLEFSHGTLNVIVNRQDGIDLDSVTAASRAISEWLDLNDPISGRFTLDVSSPGLERKLRTPEHFASAVNEHVTLRQRREGESTRRLEGTLVASTATDVTLRDVSLGDVTVAIADIERARTVFSWGSEPKPSPSKGGPSKNKTTKG